MQNTRSSCSAAIHRRIMLSDSSLVHHGRCILPMQRFIAVVASRCRSHCRNTVAIHRCSRINASSRCRNVEAIHRCSSTVEAIHRRSSIVETTPRSTSTVVAINRTTSDAAAIHRWTSIVAANHRIAMTLLPRLPAVLSPSQRFIALI